MRADPDGPGRAGRPATPADKLAPSAERLCDFADRLDAEGRPDLSDHVWRAVLEVAPDVTSAPPTMPVQVNRAGVEHARSLISDDQYVKDSDWSEARPSTDDENGVLDRGGWGEYAKWFLAEDTDEDEGTKARYKFPYGDFRRVHRSGLVAATQRAAEWDYDDVERAAARLLEGVPSE